MADQISGPTDTDARYAEMIVGAWSNFHHGERTMTVRPDGTATMVIVLVIELVIELTGIKANLFTPRLEDPRTGGRSNGPARRQPRLRVAKGGMRRGNRAGGTVSRGPKA